jgi:hypothetical protein
VPRQHVGPHAVPGGVSGRHEPTHRLIKRFMST